MKSIVIPILMISCMIFSLTKTEDLLTRGDEFYFKGDFLRALEYYYEAEESDVKSIGAKTGIYNASINSGGIKKANEYAYKLLKLSGSEIDQDRVIYSDALLGKTGYADKLLRQGTDYFRKKQIYSLAGYGLSQTGYYLKTADWYKKALDNGINSDELRKGYSSALRKLNEDIRYIDAAVSVYDYGDNRLLQNGFNFNINYNFGKGKHRFNTNFVLQHTSIDPEMNSELGFLFYDNIGQYEFFGQYNYSINQKLTVYGGLKGSALINDYIQGLGAVSAGARMEYGILKCNTFANYSKVSYSYYEFNENPLPRAARYSTFSDSFSTLQYTFDGSLNLSGAYAGGIVYIVSDIGSDYASDMLNSDRDSLVSALSPSIIKGRTRYLYGFTAGSTNEEFDIFGSWTTGDIFLVNTGEGRYLNTNDSELKQNIMAGITFKKLFGDWVLGYTFSYSDFEEYTILTNSIIANYNWRNK